MYRYLAARLTQLFFVLLFLSIIVFTIVRLIPGDPAAVMLGTESTPAAVAQIRREMGLDAPIPVQYVKWLRHVLQGNFGTSWVSKKPALELIVGALPVTLQLVGAAFVVALVVAAPAGILAAIRPRSWIDQGSTTFALLGISMPSFWLGIMLVLLFALTSTTSRARSWRSGRCRWRADDRAEPAHDFGAPRRRRPGRHHPAARNRPRRLGRPDPPARRGRGPRPLGDRAGGGPGRHAGGDPRRRLLRGRPPAGRREDRGHGQREQHHRDRRVD